MKGIIFFLLLVFNMIGNVFAEEKIRVAFFPNFTHAQALIGMENGEYERFTGTKIEWKAFNAGPSAMEALLSGEIDISFVGTNPAVNAFLRSKGTALKIISGVANGGASFVIRGDLNIKNEKDLIGKNLASPELGNTQDVALKYWLKSKGLVINKDVKVNNVKNPDILLLFKKESIDGAWVPEPWATRLIQEANGKIFLDERSLWPNGNFATAVLVVRKEFLDKNYKLVENFLKAHVNITDWINKNHSMAKKLINQSIAKVIYKPIPDKVLDEAFTKVTFTYDPAPYSIFKSAERAKDLGYLPKNDKTNLNEILDLSILNKVLKNMGKKQIN
ncbi:MAG: ABC transporter substrate-binding protein [Proteobacteria bacterium]|nr:ABC transporter substrate-binding protein [Pseudomonadota bacterium]